MVNSQKHSYKNFAHSTFFLDSDLFDEHTTIYDDLESDDFISHYQNAESKNYSADSWQ